MATKSGKKAQAGDKRRLILHFGAQKTGSTSIQRYLMHNAAELANRLIIRAPVEGSPMRALGQAAIKFSLRQADSEILLRVAFEDVLETFPENNVPVLISHENLAGAMPGNGGETALYPMLPTIMKQLSKWANSFQIDYVLYTRPMESWKPSIWAQAVRSDGYAKAYEEFLKETRHIPEWDDLVERISDAVGAKKISCFSLYEEPDQKHPARSLLRLAGLSDAEIDDLKPLKNMSMQQLSPASTEFLRQLNGLPINPQARRKVAELVARTQDLFNAELRPEGTL